MPRAIPKAAFLIVGIVTPATASPENVAFPAGYKAHVLYASIDRPDNKTVRDLYASPEAAPLAALGRPLPDGTILTLEGYKKGRERPDDKNGRAGIFVMEKRRRWRSEYPQTLRNGEREYARFTPGGQLQPGFDAKPCFQCHKPASSQDFVFSLPKLAQPRKLTFIA